MTTSAIELPRPWRMVTSSEVTAIAHMIDTIGDSSVAQAQLTGLRDDEWFLTARRQETRLADEGEFDGMYLVQCARTLEYWLLVVIGEHLGRHGFENLVPFRLIEVGGWADAVRLMKQDYDPPHET